MKTKTLIFSFALLISASQVWAKIPADLQSRFEQAVQLANDGKTAKSEKLYRHLIKQYPKVPELYNNLAVLLVKQGKPEKAVKILEQGLRSQDSYASMYNNLVDINLSLSARNYMKALVPVGDDTPKLKNREQLSEIADIYYGKADEERLAMAEKLKQAEAARDRAEARAREEAQAKAEAEQRARSEAQARARAEAEAADRAKAADAARARADAAARAREEAQARAQAAAKAQADAEARMKLASQESKAPELQDSVPPVMNLEEQANAAVMAWADAWSRQDVQAYLDAYVDGYSSDNLSRAEWVKQRKRRLTRPAWIKLKLSNFEYMILEGNRIAVQFKQQYSRKNYSDQEQKELVLVREGNRWKIEKERSL